MLGPMTIPVSLVALFFFGMGLAALVRPAFVVGLYGMTPDSPEARNEVRAVYGGFGLAIGAVLLWALHDPAAQRGVLLTVGVALVGMAFGRLVGFAIERTGPIPVLTCVGELILAAMLLAFVV